MLQKRLMDDMKTQGRLQRINPFKEIDGKELPSAYLHQESNPPPPLTILLNGILPSIGILPCGSGPPPPLTTMLIGILSSTYLHEG